VSFLQDKKPDIIVLQEAVNDSSLSPQNQVREICELIQYPYHLFSSTGLKYSQRGQTLSEPIQIGQ